MKAARLRLIVSSLLLVASLVAQRPVAPPPPEATSQQIALALRKLRSRVRVLYVTAHPDDEDNATLAWLAHGRGADVTLLTLTRGAGGQNRIGDELFESLAVLRVGELEAARRYDGATQLLGPYVDFGYSFSEEETFAKWGREHALRHLVGAIRTVKPHVILTMPARWPGGGRHHQASGQLAQEAFAVAATDRWPGLGRPHRTDRLFEQVWTVAGQDATRLYEVPVQTFDPVLGSTYDEIGFRARAQHKCQSMAQVWPPKRRRRRNFWKRLVPDPSPEDGPRDDILHGLVEDREELTFLDDEKVRFGTLFSRGARALTPFPAARAQLNRLRWLASGVTVMPRADRGAVIPGGTFTLDLHLANHGEWSRTLRSTIRFADGTRGPTIYEGPLKSGARERVSVTVTMPDALSGPFVSLTPDGDRDRYREAGPLPAASACSIESELTVGVARTTTVTGPPIPITHHFEDPAFPIAREEGVFVLPAVSASITPDVLVLPETDATRVSFRVDVRRRAKAAGRIDVVALGEDSEAVLASREVGAEDPLQTTLHPTLTSRGPKSSVRARWTPTDGKPTWLSRIREVSYPHIRRRFLRDDATARVVRVPVTFDASEKLAYVEGSGDRVLPMLRTLMPDVAVLTDEDLRAGRFADFDVIVLGVRAYRRAAVRRVASRLHEWVASGGHLVVQYQRADDLTVEGVTAPLAPKAARLTRKRITVEESPVRILDPKHRFFRTPNVIGSADFEGWVQERGVYFLAPEDPAFVPLLELEDPWPANAGKQTGSLVTVQHGAGTWTYTGLALFRQLPRGIPGAWRLFANLIARPH